MPFHVRITRKSNRSHDEVRLDLNVQQLRERFLNNYSEGRPIVIGGMTIPPDDIERIRINYTRESSERLLPQIREERRRSNSFSMTSDEWCVANSGEDVTDEYITGAPGSGVTQRSSDRGAQIEGPRVVFVVHGRNTAMRDAMFTFLRSIGLHPLEWSEAVCSTGNPTPYIGEILESAFSIAQAIIVLMTPDDEAQLREEFRQPGDPLHETQLTPQARPNVIFEAGLAFGRNPQRTVLVEVGTLRPFSDIAGRHIIRLNNSTQRRQEFALRLQSAGCLINLTGTDWQTTGSFELNGTTHKPVNISQER